MCDANAPGILEKGMKNKDIEPNFECLIIDARL